MLRVSILVLGAATGLIHLGVGLFGERVVLMFILNGLGYLALVAAFGLDPGWLRSRRALLLGAFMVYAAVTVIGWVAFGQRTVVAYVDKAIEILLILALARYWRAGPPIAPDERVRRQSGLNPLG